MCAPTERQGLSLNTGLKLLVAVFEKQVRHISDSEDILETRQFFFSYSLPDIAQLHGCMQIEDNVHLILPAIDSTLALKV